MVQFNLPKNSKILKGQYFKDNSGSKNLKIVHIYRWDPEKNENPREDTFEVNLETSINLNKLLPKDTYLISESGIASKEDIDFLQKNNIYGYLIGESFMKEKDPGNALKLFTSKKNADKSAF